MTQQDPDTDARPASRGTVRTLDYIRTAHITTEVSFDAYWEMRGKNLRQNLKKQRNRLARDGNATRLQINMAVAEMAQAVAATVIWRAPAGKARAVP